MIPVETALEIILNSVTPLSDEEVSIFEVKGRVIYRDIVADINIPELDNSAMDGFAVISRDTVNASPESPVRLQVIDEIQAGGYHKKKQVSQNTAIRIMTGAPIPEFADSIIPVEDTKEENGVVSIFKELKKHENVRFAGEDISKGQTVLRKGDIIKSADVGLLASLNYKDIRVFKRPGVAIISTGDEIVDIGDELIPGQNRNSNAYTLYSEIKKYNAIPYYLGIAKDTMKDLRQKIKKALKYDIVITTGGVSMGKYDFVKDVINDLEIEIKIDKILMKPGKPLVFGTRGDKNKLFFGLPGNPVSTMIGFIQFVRPVILRLMGANKIDKPVFNAILENDIRKKPERKHFIRGYFSIKNGAVYVSTTGPQGSGILTSMSEANCLIILPVGAETAKAGGKVSIQLIDHGEI